MWEAIQDRSPIAWGRAFVASLLRASAHASPGERPARATLSVVPDSPAPAYAAEFAPELRRPELRIAERSGAEMELASMLMPEGVKYN